MNLYQWALKHSVGMDAIVELRALWGDVDKPAEEELKTADSEALVQSSVLMEGARKGVRLYRNNVGALLDERGRLVRYGLANDTKLRNATIKSADLIGVRPVLITPGHIGQTIGQFVSRECKKPSWRFGEDPAREEAQLAWATLIISCGGDAQIVNAEGSL